MLVEEFGEDGVSGVMVVPLMVMGIGLGRRVGLGREGRSGRVLLEEVLLTRFGVVAGVGIFDGLTMSKELKHQCTMS